MYYLTSRNQKLQLKYTSLLLVSIVMVGIHVLPIIHVCTSHCHEDEATHDSCAHLHSSFHSLEISQGGESDHCPCDFCFAFTNSSLQAVSVFSPCVVREIQITPVSFTGTRTLETPRHLRLPGAQAPPSNT